MRSRQADEGVAPDQSSRASVHSCVTGSGGRRQLRITLADMAVPTIVTTVVCGTAVAFTAPPSAPPGGPYVSPVARVDVVAEFDPPARPWQPGHRGVDLAATAGDVVRAPADGVVTFAGRVVDRGVVTIDHGGIRTTYEPVDPAVTTGATLTAGTTIGRVGEGAHCSQRCLHWGALLGSDYIDPLALLVRYSPVLKPPFES